MTPNRPQVSLVIPVLNEELILPSLLKNCESLAQEFQGKLEVIFSDSGSTDSTAEILRTVPWINFVENSEKKPLAIATSFLKGAAQARGRWILLCCADSILSHQCLRQLFSLEYKEYSYGFFQKEYAQANWILKLQSLYLNRIRAQFFKDFVWTNAPFFKKELLGEISQNGFLDDVISSDKLNKQYLPIIFSSAKVQVSSRRYLKEGVFSRFFANILIVGLYRLRLCSIDELKSVYYGRSSFAGILSPKWSLKASSKIFFAVLKNSLCSTSSTGSALTSSTEQTKLFKSSTSVSSLRK